MTNSYRHTSKNLARTKEERLQEYYDTKMYLVDDMKINRSRHPATLLLDSSLITATQNKNARIKIIQCGDYYQVYELENIQLIKDKNLEKLKDKKYDVNHFKDLDTDKLYKKENLSRSNELKYIEFKNIQRSKFQLQRIVKANEEIFKTFITLTFADNVISIDEANKKFAIWRTKIKSIYKEFSYICVPEFQKRGAVHYHLLTNIEINKEYQYFRYDKIKSTKLIYNQENSINIITQKQYKNQYDVKYWPYGFTSVFPMKDINVIGYISKYMTKDIDNRLWGKRRYLCSNNLKKPTITYLDLEIDQDLFTYLDIINKCDVQYSKEYKTVYGENIFFLEYKTRSEYSP